MLRLHPEVEAVSRKQSASKTLPHGMRERDVILLWFVTIAVPMGDAVSIPGNRIKPNLCLALFFQSRFQLI